MESGPTHQRVACGIPETYGQHGVLLGQESLGMNGLWHGFLSNTSTYNVPENIVSVIGGGYGPSHAIPEHMDANYF